MVLDWMELNFEVFILFGSILLFLSLYVCAMGHMGLLSLVHLSSGSNWTGEELFLQ